MTRRLYYDDPYLLKFEATIMRAEPDGENTRIWLDESAFYPTSGGQPYDFGTIGGHEIQDVVVENDDVVHTIAGTLSEGERVSCAIDAKRRGDHMRQHCGEHMLAYLLWKRYAGLTHGLHIGADFSTIDVSMPNGETHLSQEELISLEEELNEWIQRDEPVRCWFPSAEELPKVPLRKQSAVKEHVRIVHIAPDEYVACGGTHPRRTGEIGCVRILDAKPSRGKLRVSFVCGMRAVCDNRKKTDICLSTAEALSASWETLPQAVSRLSQRCAQLNAELRALRKIEALTRLTALTEQAETAPDGTRVVAARIDGLDAQSLREAAGAIAEREDCYVLAASVPEPGADALLAFVRGAGRTLPMGALLSETAKSFGGKGGGRPDFAQGAVSDPDGALRFALSHLTNSERA